MGRSEQNVSSHEHREVRLGEIELDLQAAEGEDAASGREAASPK